MAMMIDVVIAVILAALANWAVIECWHHGVVFEKPRAWLEAHDPGFLVDLFTCPYCLSHWTAAPLFVATLVLFTDLQGWPWYRWFALPVLSFAVTRLSNLMNDACHSFCRTPHSPDIEEELAQLQDVEDAEGHGGTQGGSDA